MILQFHSQIHPWLPIINGVQQENEKIEMEKKGEVDKVEKDKMEENQGEADKEFPIMHDWNTWFWYIWNELDNHESICLPDLMWGTEKDFATHLIIGGL